MSSPGCPVWSTIATPPRNIVLADGGAAPLPPTPSLGTVEMSWASRMGRAAERARVAADALRSEYRSGRDGDPENLPPPVTLWDRPTFDQLVSLITRRSSTESDVDSGGTSQGASTTPQPNDDAPHTADTPDATDIDQSVAEVSETLGRVDWRAVSDELANRSTDVTARVQQLAAGIDWDRMKPAASKVASALIAAAATGQLGRLSGPGVMAIARAVRDEQGVGEAAATAVLSRAPGGAAATAVMRTFLSERPDGATGRGDREPIGTFEASEPAAPTGIGVVEQRLAELRQVVELRREAE